MILFAFVCLYGVVAVVRLFQLPRVGRETVSGSVSLLIPARNEEFTLPGCLLSAVFTSAAEVLVYDDQSQDGTARVVRSTMLRYDRIRLIEGGELPDGWVGKPWACRQLAGAAKSEWLLFADAGARISSRGVERLLAEAERRGVTLISCWPEFTPESLAGKLLYAGLSFCALGFLPKSLAAGSCILVHRGTYELLGGHAAVRGEVGCDAALLRLWGRSGERACVMDGGGVGTVTRPDDWSSIQAAFRRHFYPAFPSGLQFWAFLAVQFSAGVLPFLMGNWLAAGAGLIVPVLYAWRLRRPVWTGLLHPVALVLLCGAGLGSAFRKETEWKGRRYI